MSRYTFCSFIFYQKKLLSISVVNSFSTKLKRNDNMEQNDFEHSVSNDKLKILVREIEELTDKVLKKKNSFIEEDMKVNEKNSPVKKDKV